MKVIAVIPARLASTRLARKVLLPIAGQPMLARVYEGVRAASALADVVIATDSQEILDLCRQRGWHARLTAASCRSGAERVHEVSQAIPADVYVNVQGDEPLARAEHINSLIKLMKDATVQVGTLKTPCAATDLNNPHAVKVVTDVAGR